MSKIAEYKAQNTKRFHNVIGIDIGSRAAKAVLLTGEDIYFSLIPTGMIMQESADELLADLLQQSGLTRSEIYQIVGTGYGRIAMEFDDIPLAIISEISAHAMGVHFLNPNAKTIIDIGGQDSKAIKVNPETGKVDRFLMNDKCAAGTGRFLEKCANLLEHEVDDIGPLALNSTKDLQISSQCVVFAESEVVSLRARGEAVEDILSAVHYATAKRVYTLLKRVNIEDDIVFSGGVSNNEGMHAAFEKLTGQTIHKLKLDMSYAGALGSAVYGQKVLEGEIQLDANTPKEEAQDNADIQALIARMDEIQADFIQHKDDGIPRVGYLCSYTPLELINASGAKHLRLIKAGNPEEVSVGDMLTTSVFCDFTKSCLGAFQEGNPLMKALDKVYMFDTCHPMQKTVEVINEKFTPSSIFLLPRCRDEANSRSAFRNEVLHFKEDLEALTGTAITEEMLREQIRLYNQARSIIRQISALRKRRVPPIKGKEFLDIVKGHYYLKPEEQIATYGALLEKLKQKKGAGKKPLRIMMSGGIVAEGDRKILDILEDEFDVRVVCEDHCTGLNPVYYDVEETGDVYQALANGYLDSAPCARMVPLDKRIAHADHMAEEYHVDAIIYKYLKFCPCYGLSRHVFITHFQDKGIPILEISNDYSTGDIGQIKTRIEAFIEVLREKKSEGKQA